MTRVKTSDYRDRWEWRYFRRRIFRDRGAQCENCGKRDRTIDVHHRVYYHDRYPWAYRPDEVLLLCRECHEQWHSAHKIRTHHDNQEDRERAGENGTDGGEHIAEGLGRAMNALLRKGKT